MNEDTFDIKAIYTTLYIILHILIDATFNINPG